MVVSQRLARHLWGGEDPLGRTLRIGARGPTFTVIGVARDVRAPRFGVRGLSASPLPDLYLSRRQVSEANTELLLRAKGDPNALEGAVRDAVRATDAGQAILRVRTLADQLALSTLVLRPIDVLMSIFAASGLGLALIGIFGVVSHGVARRTREIGIRMALGATPRDAVRLAMGDGVQLTAIGVAVGLIAAAGLWRSMARVLWGVSPLDVPTYAGVSALFAAIALLACYLAARRAARVQPANALRQD